jgi:hypothetical protein
MNTMGGISAMLQELGRKVEELSSKMQGGDVFNPLAKDNKKSQEGDGEEE